MDDWAINIAMLLSQFLDYFNYILKFSVYYRNFFSYDIRLSIGEGYGGRLPNGTFTGSLGYMQRKVIL